MENSEEGSRGEIERRGLGLGALGGGYAGFLGTVVSTWLLQIGSDVSRLFLFVSLRVTSPVSVGIFVC